MGSWQNRTGRAMDDRPVTYAKAFSKKTSALWSFFPFRSGNGRYE